MEGEVEASLSEARGLSPGSPEPLQGLASLRQQQGKDEEALQLVRQSMALWFKPAPEDSEEEEEEGKGKAAGGSGKKAAAAQVRRARRVLLGAGAARHGAAQHGMACLAVCSGPPHCSVRNAVPLLPPHAARRPRRSPALPPLGPPMP